MAEAILFGLTRKMIEELGSQIFQNFGSPWGVKDELENLKKTVSTIQAVLQDAAEKSTHNNQVKAWLERLKDAVYEADDLLNEFHTQASRSNKVLALTSMPNPVNFKMSRRIKKMKKKLDKIAKDRIDFHLEERIIEPHVVNRKGKPTHSFVSEEEVIGRKDNKNAIIELLLDPNVKENVSVIPIVGMGGIGKTTLAQCVFNDEKIKEYFEPKIWVCVSAFEWKVVAKKIIASVTDNSPPNLELDQLQKRLREQINGKKFLLVLDDVWLENHEEWLDLKNLLIGGLKGSKILITTRSSRVAQMTGTGSSYHLDCLTDNHSWLLFKRVTFRDEQVANNQLVTIGREIVKICKGLPLAIKSIGHELRHKGSEDEWLLVKNGLQANIIEKEDTVLSILKLSYDHLPSHLKSCFAYCSLFPKNYVMDKETLIHLWIAQGFIPSSKINQQLEDIADEYFKDLFWRSFFDEIKDAHGVLKYKMHDLMHNLANLVAGAECKLVDCEGKNIDEKIRHVSCPFSINSSLIETFISQAKAKKIRTFLLTFGEDLSGSLDESMLDTLILSFKSVRALDLHGLKITRVPNSVEKLKHLRYLDLSWNESINTLPDAITRLWNLQTLKLKSCRNLKQLPKDIKELVNLQHLDNSGCYGLSHMPYGLGQMTWFQTLKLFVVSKDLRTISRRIGRLEELNKLNSLKGTIEIAHLELLLDANSESKAANLREKRHLEKLILRWDEIGNLKVDDDDKSLEGLQPNKNLKFLTVYGYGGVTFSSWISSLTNLVNLMLHTCKRCRYLPQLSQLSSLEHLSLENMYDLEYISDSEIIEVPASLKSLKIKGCPELKGWWRRRDFVGEVNNKNDNVVATTSTIMPYHLQHQHHPLALSLPSFRCLSSLSIYDCPYLTSMPLFPYLEESLILRDVDMEPLRQTMAMASSLTSSSSSSLFYPLSKLKSMCLMNIRDMTDLSDEWVLNLKSLKCLEICDCPGLTSLSQVTNITSLEELWVVNCEKFDPLSNMDDDGMEWRHLNCLQSLTFESLPKLKSLPAGLQHVTILQKLVISGCPNLVTLPEWISKLTSLERLGIDGYPNLTSLPNGISCLKSLRWLIIAGFLNLMTFPEWISNLTSLEQLQILRCPKLTSLPTGMSHLTSLQMLRIVDCPHLEKNCEEETGVDWLKISHVPTFSNQLGIFDTYISGMSLMPILWVQSKEQIKFIWSSFAFVALISK